MPTISNIKINRQEVSDRLEDIHRATQELERFQSMDARAFRAGKDNVAITSHWLHISLEAILTIESHILSNISNQETKKGWEQKKKETGQKNNSDPKETKNAKAQQSPSLTRQGILPKDLSQRMKGIKQYRDRMAHEYWKIQPEELLQMTQKGLPDFKEFEKQIRNSFSLGSGGSTMLSNTSLLSLLAITLIAGSLFLFRDKPQEAEAALTVNSPVPNNNSITNGLVGHWTFDGPDIDWSSTGTEIKDTSGNGNDGDASTSGMDTTNAVAGKIGQGLYFDGNDQVVEVAADAAFEDLGPVTISAWVYPEASAYKPVYMTGDTNSAFIIDNSNLVFKVSYTGDTLQREGVYNSTILNNWSHIVVTWDGGTTATNIHIYQNGTEVGSYGFTQDATGTRYSDSGLSLYIGNDPYGANDFIGVIDDVRVYNRVLSSDEVQALYNLGH